MSGHVVKNTHSHNRRPSWLRRAIKRRTKGQALVEYVLILALVVVALVAVLTITGPAVGNVFSNTVFNLLGGTIEPRDTMAADDFWTQVAAVASYTPPNPGLITNTPAPPTNTHTPGPSPTPTDITPSPIPTLTYTPGPSPTPPNQNWGYPFTDTGDNPDWWQSPDFQDLITNDWTAEYWNYSAFGWRNNMSAMPDGSGVYTTALSDLNFYYSSGVGPYPSVEENFYARFKSTVTLEAKDYTFRIRRNEGIRIWVDGTVVVDQNVPNSGDPATWTTWSSDTIKDNWFDRKFTATAGTHDVVVEFVDVSGEARLTLALLELSDPMATATWFAEYWNYTTYGWQNDMSAMNSSNRVASTYYNALDFDLGSTTSPYSGVNRNFYARFTATLTFLNKPYVFTISRDNGVRIWVGGNLVVGADVPNTGDPETWTSTTDTSTFERTFTPTAGDHEVIVEWVDTGSSARLHVNLKEQVDIPEGNCGWALSNEEFHTPPQAWSDSPGTSYSLGSLCILELRGTIDLTAAANPQLEFYDRYNLETGAIARVGVSVEGSNTWTDIDFHNSSTNLAWGRQTFDLKNFNGVNFGNQRILLRFVLDARNATTPADGWWIDDIKVENFIAKVYTVGFADDMETTSHWYPGGTWARANEASHSPGNAWTDSPNTTYLPGTDSVLELDGYINLADPMVTVPEITFWHRYNLGAYDAIYAEVSIGDRNHWQNLTGATNNPADALDYGLSNWAWSQEVISLLPFKGSQLYFRFRLVSDSGASVGEGWWIDDFIIRNQSTAVIYPDWCDSMEYGGDNWVAEGSWGVVNGLDTNQLTGQVIDSHDGMGFWSDSRGANYLVNTNSSLRLASTLSLSGSTHPELIFWQQWDLQYSANLYVEISADGGSTWNPEWAFLYGGLPPDLGSVPNRGYNASLGWTRNVINLSSYAGQNINIRFRLDTRVGTVAGDGWWIDQVCIQEHNEPVRTVGFSDNFENGPSNWYVGGQWSIVDEPEQYPRHAFTDSPGLGVDYIDKSNSSLELKGVVDLTGTVKPVLYYWDQFEISRKDYALVEVKVSDDGGYSWGGWDEIGAATQENATTRSWDREQVDLSPYIPSVAHPNRVIRLRFRLYAPQTTSTPAVKDGWWIDDVSLADINGDPVYSLPFYEDADSLNSRWVFDHTWVRIPFFRMLGSGNALSPGGWTGYYYYDANSNENFDSADPLEFVDHDIPEIDFNWAYSQPVPDPTEGGSDLPDANHFLVRWWRTIYVTSDNTTYYIETRSDDGVRLIVDPPGDPATDSDYPNGWTWTVWGWTNRAYNTNNPDTGSVVLSQGLHTILVEFYENTGAAQVRVDFGKNGYVFHDSIDSSTNYNHMSNMSITLEGAIDLAGTTFPTLSYWHMQWLGSGDSCKVEASTDGGFNWSTLMTYSSTDSVWRQEYVNLGGYVGQKINIRFRTDARTDSEVGDGCYFDDIIVAE